MFQVVTLQVGDKYGDHYVTALRRSLKRYGHDLIVLGREYPLPDLPLEGWWWKTYLFSPDFQNEVGDVFWLEEDCDAGLFIEAYRARFACLPFIRHRDDGDYSPVRSMRHVHQLAPIPFAKAMELLAHLRAKGNEACLVAA